jgi:fructose-1,6-bisphosphatase I
MTLEQYLATGAEPRLAALIGAIMQGCEQINSAVRRGDVMGALDSENVQGEVQKKLDVLANDILLAACPKAPALIAMASEELDDISRVREVAPAGGYLLLFDPLDGSSNIEVNVSIGTIFSILPAPEAPRRAAEAADFLQPGRRQVAAGYVVYGPQTTLVLSLGDGVAAFNLDPDGGGWRQTQERVSVPVETKEYAINASNARHWAEPVRRYVEDCLAGESGRLGKNYNMRWVGSMVADVHRVLMRGGVFLYPWDAREPNRAGKLRLMYEANPMAMLVEQAGGAAFDGEGATLDARPTGLHQRVAVMLGSKSEVQRLEQLHAETLHTV